jgi:hypothetical protein
MVTMGTHDYLMLGEDGRLTTVDLTGMVQRHQNAHIEARAELIGQAVDLFADPAFDIGETYDVAEAAMPGAMVNAAAYIGLILREVELGGE